jgi:hypothetical protein
LAPFLLFAAVLACGSPALTPGTPSATSTAAGDIEEISLEISSLM